MTTKRVTFTGVKGYLLDTVQGRDYLSRDFEFQGNVQAFWGIRVWILGPNEKEEIVQKYGNGKTGVKIVNLKRRSAVMVRVYVWKEGGNPVPLETFITEPLNAVRLDSSLWKIFYCTDSNYDSKRGVTVTSYRFGNATYNSRIEGFAWAAI
jgi:hypothetical protein